MHPIPDPIRPGQESVWSYPRPPILQPAGHRLRIVHRGIVVADTADGFRVLETSHPPTYYFPLADVAQALLLPSAHSASWCEWKGAARYWDVAVGPDLFEAVAWSYPAPSGEFASLRDHLAFYATPFDECTVGGETARPQPGGFYGGWVTSREAGPFKGIPGSRFW